ncbi:hypothetical protein FUAX_24180 [Fulvitalea axinellae]|uniref:Uncharacterized protein n=1 Tax=Fulvitalea axinellae TaxID=1182444 RepID=A0AAU9DAM3_9BACT|nr:hypothetical protein FUAX_24180 [Fulvitalea axinellae]
MAREWAFMFFQLYCARRDDFFSTFPIGEYEAGHFLVVAEVVILNFMFYAN